MYVRPLIASAERWIGSRQRWSGMRARDEPRPPEADRGADPSLRLFDVDGAASSSAHESAQYARSPAVSTCRARTRFPSIPSARSDRSRMRLPGAARVGGVPVPVDERPLRRLPAVVEDGLAHQLDLDLPVDAVHRANEHVVGVVVRGRPRVRCDRVHAAVRSHRERVSDLDPARRRLPGRDEDVRPGLVARARTDG